MKEETSSLLRFTVWMTHQVYQTDLRLGLRSWVFNLLPLFPHCNPQSTELILHFAEIIMAQPEAHTIAKMPFVLGLLMIPPPSIEPLLHFRIPDTPERSEEDTARVERIYTWLKDVALRRAPDFSYIIQEIFTVSLRLVGQGNNPAFVEEAAAIAIWSLTEKDVCWKHWYSLCKENLEASVALLKTLVEKWNYHPFKPSSRKAMKQQFIQQIFNVSLRLTGQGISNKQNLEFSALTVVAGNSVLAKEAAAIAIWSLTKNIDCWKRWDYLYEENMEGSVALLEELEENWNEHSLKLLSSPSDTLTLSQTIKSFRLKNKQNIALNFSSNVFLHKESDKSCKVISGRLSRGLKGTCITAVVLVTAVAAAAAALVLPESVFGFYK